jgi:TolB-like protein
MDETKLMNQLNVKLISLVLGTALLITGCHQTYAQKHQEASVPLGKIEYYTHALATELFEQLIPTQQVRFAVATFVPVTSFEYDPNQQHPLMLLGHQLEQGMMTEASKFGFIPQDFKATNDIIIGKQAERVFSRDVDELYLHHHNIDYYLSGTLVEQEDGYIVNARVIDVVSKDVVAAATQFFPSDIFWQHEQLSTRNGLLIRTSR